MPPPAGRTTLSRVAVAKIRRAVDGVFDRVKARVLGPQSVPKRIYVGREVAHSVPGVYAAASREEGVVPDERVLAQLLEIAGGYLDAQRERTKARVVRAVQSFVHEAHRAAEPVDARAVLGGQLSEVWSDAVNSVRRIVDSETQHAKSVGFLEGISRVNAAAGIEDPVVYFVVVKDGELCKECRRLHLMPDGVTPRLWRLSEVGHVYHKRGDAGPKVSGLHPSCRCAIVTLMPGYGFVRGAVSYVSPGYDELAAQRG